MAVRTGSKPKPPASTQKPIPEIRIVSINGLHPETPRAIRPAAFKKGLFSLLRRSWGTFYRFAFVLGPFRSTRKNLWHNRRSSCARLVSSRVRIHGTVAGQQQSDSQVDGVRTHVSGKLPECTRGLRRPRSIGLRATASVFTRSTICNARRRSAPSTTNAIATTNASRVHSVTGPSAGFRRMAVAAKEKPPR